ncbi:hypothetical protein CLAFUW4_09582 [Fulvia fulva]|uniref:BRCT domain-containing protein n=1 Tax=Passalora fulva TaxID=5499 RepID=A0A9Q8UTP2_PASFU|nr:uncharacterized protein CLAFUR5_09676 [Fulvia fulva]KAK4613691.1 hypothetical protein CLAFUR4_09587 [Fulvia fulva]KAK4615091.1 hypothetical protein CLAFUR0_09578 [Fulvia fulva]UJO22076.1 hypothetical protein CLAFUR5_09676 [Fulvia fulva]WPV20285.1 hypothetical protein CLAFUW4_09582 [Fulvia fulva]WPV35680.1 hypothetical protein CLAFUW7_09583 [Fulvia fulva]
MPTKAPPAAKPSKNIFDPFNSSATGHQRADNRLSGSTSWRDSRSLKLRQQFSAGAGGGKRVSDTVGAGSLDFGLDGRTENGGWVRGAKGLRTGGQQSLWETVKVTKDEEDEDRPAKRVKVEAERDRPNTVVSPFTPFRKADGTVRETSWTSHECSPSDLLEPIDPAAATPDTITKSEPTKDEEKGDEPPKPPQVFAYCNFYINGSTAPYSDHKIKHIFSTHGGNTSISLGRRTVTHVVIGKPSKEGGACGGGLASSKIQKEITSKCGNSVKFVNVEWVMDSVKMGKRQPESKYEGMKLAPKGVKGINTMFKPKEKEK